MKQVIITEVNNGYIVKLKDGEKEIERPYIYRAIDELVLLEFVGDFLVGKKIKAEVR